MLTKLTIIIATYNAGQCLKSAIESVLSQSYPDWECLIVDGGSSDDTLEIIDNFEKCDNRIRHISEKDKGIYDAFNKGWMAAKGEWIYYLGSDDRLTRDGMAALMKVSEKSDEGVGMINGGVYRISQDGRKKRVMSSGYIGSHQGMIMRRSAIEELGGFDLKYKVIADYDLFIRMKNSMWDVINTNAIVAYFNAGGTSEKFSSSYLVFKEKVEILQGDSYCKFPVLKALFDGAKTFFGGCFHRVLKRLHGLSKK